MSASTIRRVRILSGIALVALIAFAAARAAPPESFAANRPAGSNVPVALQRLMPKYLPTKGFYESYVAPRMSAGLHAEIGPAAEAFAVPTSNLWARDPIAAQRVGGRSVRNVEAALKSYAIERLGLDHWTFPLGGANGRGASAPGADAGGAKFRLGFSHLAPRADVLIPVTAGRVVVSADARGRVGTRFEPTTSRLRLEANIDVPRHAATASLGVRF